MNSMLSQQCYHGYKCTDVENKYVITAVPPWLQMQKTNNPTAVLQWLEM